MEAPVKKIEPMGFQTFVMNGEASTREEVIKHIQFVGGVIFSFAPAEPDNRSKGIKTDGKRLWVEDFFGNYLHDL